VDGVALSDRLNSVKHFPGGAVFCEVFLLSRRQVFPERLTRLFEDVVGALMPSGRAVSLARWESCVKSIFEALTMCYWGPCCYDW